MRGGSVSGVGSSMAWALCCWGRVGPEDGRGASALTPGAELSGCSVLFSLPGAEAPGIISGPHVDLVVKGEVRDQAWRLRV